MFYLIFIVNPCCSIVLRKRKQKFRNNWIYKDCIALTVWIKILAKLIYFSWLQSFGLHHFSPELAANVFCTVSLYESESCSVVFNSLQPHGLYRGPEFSRPECLVGSLSLLQGTFTTQGLNPGLPHCRRILYQLSHKGSPGILEWVAYPFSSGSSWPGNQTRVSWTADRFFSNWGELSGKLLSIYTCTLSINSEESWTSALVFI